MVYKPTITIWKTPSCSIGSLRNGDESTHIPMECIPISRWLMSRIPEIEKAHRPVRPTEQKLNYACDDLNANELKLKSRSDLLAFSQHISHDTTSPKVRLVFCCLGIFFKGHFMEDIDGETTRRIASIQLTGLTIEPQIHPAESTFGWSCGHTLVGGAWLP